MVLGSANGAKVNIFPEATRSKYEVPPERTDVGQYHGTSIHACVDEDTEDTEEQLVGKREYGRFQH